MKKLILGAVALLGFCYTSQAQDSGLKAGIHIGAPMGDAADATSLNFGADVVYTWPVGKSLAFGLATGYSYFSGKEFQGIKYNASFVPAAAVTQLAVTENIFLGADLGYNFYTGDGNFDGGFYYQPKVGYMAEFFEVYIGYKGFTVDDDSPGSSTTFSALCAGFNYKF